MQSFVKMSQPQKIKVTLMLYKAITFGPRFPQGVSCSRELVQQLWTGWDSCYQADLAFPPLPSQICLVLGSIWTNQLQLALYISYPSRAITYTNSRVQHTWRKLSLRTNRTLQAGTSFIPETAPTTSTMMWFGSLPGLQYEPSLHCYRRISQLKAKDLQV